MANEAFTDGVRLLFQPLEDPVLLSALATDSTAVQFLTLDGIGRANYHALELMVQLAASADRNVGLSVTGSGLAASTGQGVRAKQGATVTRRFRVAVGSDRRVAVKLSGPCAACWIRVVGTWS